MPGTPMGTEATEGSNSVTGMLEMPIFRTRLLKLKISSLIIILIFLGSVRLIFIKITVLIIAKLMTMN